MSHFHLLRPEWLVALLPLALLLWWKYRQRPRAGDWSAVCDSALLPFVLTAGHRTGRKLALSLLGIGGILAVLALAGPTWRQLEQPVFQPRSSLVILLDLSRSMDANDLAPSRLTRARYKLLDILQRRREGETGLIVYAAQPFVVSPLTEDTGTIAALVQSLTSDIVPSQGSRADLALEQGFRLLSAANAVDGHLLIITDGIAPGLTDRVLANRPANFSVSILAVGTPEGAPIPLPGGGFLKSDAGEIVISSLGSEELRRIAANGRGVYTELAANDRDLDLLFPVFATAPLTGAEKSAGLHSDRWHEEGAWLILPLLPLAAFAFRRGYLLLALCLVLPIAEPVSASQWDQLWQRPDQLGFAQLTDGDPAGAATYFEDPEWRSAAHYRAGEYQQSLDALAGVNTPRADYNRGNALARLGRLNEALRAYDRALEKIPGDSDALFNRQLVEKLLQEQEHTAGQDSKPHQESGLANNQPRQEPTPREAGQPSQENPAQEGMQGDQDLPSDGPEKPQPSPIDENGEQQLEAHAPSGPSENQPAEETQNKSAAGQADPNGQQNGTEPLPSDTLPTPDNPLEPEARYWLQRIPDDPGGLLRRKFRYQYQQQYQGHSEPYPW